MLYAFDYDNSLSSFPHFQSGEIINELETIAIDILEMILGDRPFHHPSYQKRSHTPHTCKKLSLSQEINSQLK